MKIFRKIVLIIGVIVAIPLIVALFVSKTYEVEEAIVINKPKSEVFDYVKHLKNQDNFSKWATLDPDMNKTYHGTDGTEGFISAWESEDDNVGVGEQEIIKIIDGDRIDYELRFIKPFESTQETYMTTKSVNGNQTEVTWGFNGEIKYPMNLMLLFMDFEKFIGDDFQEGLQNLKTLLEKK